jgi:hypothetical protein
VLAIAAELSVGSYVLGSLGLIGVVAVLAWGAVQFRRRLVPDWAGPPARLVEALLVLLGLTGSAQLLGAVDAMRGAPLLALCTVVGVGMAFIGRSSSEPSARAPAVPVRRGEFVAAGLATALVAAQWVSHTARALHRGMTHPDTLAYHGPYAVRFLRDGTFGSLTGLGGRSREVLPQGSELLHAIAAVPFHRDLLSPLLNLGWAALVMLAAWCAGRRHGVGALAVLAAAVVLSLPSLAGTQPGQASNDLMSGALLLVAVVLLLEGGLQGAVAGLAGTAAGLALAAKLTVAAPVLALAVGVIILSVRSRRAWAAVSWCSGLILACSYWFIRDWFIAGSPAPFLNITIGPISLKGAEPETGTAAIHYLTNGTVWRRYYLPGLSHAFGPVWPLLLGLALGAAVSAIVRRRIVLEQVVGLAILFGVLAYPFIPLSAAAGGKGFQYALRYLTPVLLLAFILLARQLVDAGSAWRWTVCGALTGLVALNATLRELIADRMPAWPKDGWLAGVAAGLAVLAVITVWPTLRSLLPRPEHFRAILVAVAVLPALLVGGWFVQREYFRGRYVRAGLSQDAIQTSFHGVRNASVAVLGDPEIYPMFGVDLSNRVTTPTGPTEGDDASLCRHWKQLLSDRYRYVVLGHVFIFAFVPPQGWFVNDPAAVTVVRGRDYAVFRLDRSLDPTRCSNAASQ